MMTAVGTRPAPPGPRGQNGLSCTEEIKRRPHHPWQRNNTVNLPNSYCHHAVGQGRGPAWLNRKVFVMLLTGIYLQFLCSGRKAMCLICPGPQGPTTLVLCQLCVLRPEPGSQVPTPGSSPLSCRDVGGRHRLHLSPAPFCPSLSQRTAYFCSDVSSAVALENRASPGCGY